MIKYWFYCENNAPTENPDGYSMYSISPSKDMIEEYIGASYPSLDNVNDERWDKVFKCMNYYRKLFRQLCRSIIDDINIDGLYITNSEIPKAKRILNSIGWKEEYIPFGP